jgi:hypothetical protein
LARAWARSPAGSRAGALAPQAVGPKGSTTGWQVRMPHNPERFRGVAAPRRKSLPATGAKLGLGVAVGGVYQGLAALVAVGPTAAGGIPVDTALGVSGRMLSAVGFFTGEAAGEFLGFLFAFGFGPGLCCGGLCVSFSFRRGVFRYLLGVAGLLLEEKESLAHGEGLARGPGGLPPVRASGVGLIRQQPARRCEAGRCKWGRRRRARLRWRDNGART